MNVEIEPRCGNKAKKKSKQMLTAGLISNLAQLIQWANLYSISTSLTLEADTFSALL